MRYFKHILLFIFLSGSVVFAQNKDILSDLIQPAENGGAVIMEQDSLLTSLIALQRDVNRAKGGVDGFKIRLYRGNDVLTARDEAEKVKAMFLLEYPNEVVDLDYDPPVWFVRVGNFKTYGEALKLRNELEKTLSEIKDGINIVPSTVKIN